MKFHFLWLAYFVGVRIASAFVFPRVPFWSKRRRATTKRMRSASHEPPSSDEDNNTGSPPKIGFIGCGTIASAIATGLAPSVSSITVTERSTARSSALKANFPERVRVSSSNQAVLDAADIIFLTVLPPQTKEVLRELKFDASRHILVSLVSTSNLAELSADARLPPSRVYKMICLPAVAYQEGVCLLQAPAVETAESYSILYDLLDSLGGVVLADDDRQMSAMMVPSAMMGSFYGMLGNYRDWLVQNGNMSPDKASYLVTRYFHGMMQDALRQCSSKDALDDLIAEQTPGGLNEQGLSNMKSLGVMDSHEKVQDAVFKRVLGESNGAL